jgi:hypothetical protein
MARLEIRGLLSIIDEHTRHMAMLKALGPTVRNIKMILGNKTFQQTAEAALGKSGLAQLKQQIQRSLQQTVQSGEPMEKLIGRMRGRVSKSILLFHPSVIVTDRKFDFGGLLSLGGWLALGVGG